MFCRFFVCFDFRCVSQKESFRFPGLSPLLLVTKRFSREERVCSFLVRKTGDSFGFLRFFGCL